MLTAALTMAAASIWPTGPLSAQSATDPMELTLERMVELALNSSYRVRDLNLDVERTRLNLEASRAGLRSRVDLDFSLPTINHVSETRWDPDLQQNVIQRENSRRLEAELSVRQPVILFGYPTNGYLSLNTRLYRLNQRREEGTDVRYYNRSFVSYTQPFFQANELKNEIEEAELDFEDQELDFYDEVVGIIDNTIDDYFGLYEIAYQSQILESYVQRLERALGTAQDLAVADPDRDIDADQIRVELVNAQEDVLANESRFRLETSSLKTEFGIPEERVIRIDPVISLTRVPVDAAQATAFALELAPRIRRLEIQRRESEIELSDTEGDGGLELDVSLSYGREMQDPVFEHMWSRPENSYTVDVEGSIPLWDWGERDRRIEAERLQVQQSVLRIEEASADIRNDVRNEVRNVEEFQARAFSMQENLDLSRTISETSLERYAQGTVSALDLLQSLRREMDTAENFLDAYLGWRGALRELQDLTYYDWERGMPLLDTFGISFGDGAGSASR